MTFDPQKPRYTISLDGKDYEVEGSFALIEAIENALKEDIISITLRCLQMQAGEMAKLVATILKKADDKITLDQVKETFWKTGVLSEEYTQLCYSVLYFLRLCIAKPTERAAVANDAGEHLREMKARSDSLGKNISDSVSAS